MDYNPAFDDFVDPQKVKEVLGYQPGMLYLPEMPAIPGGRFLLKTWWAKAWLQPIEKYYDNDILTKLRYEARIPVFYGMCITPDGLRAWYSQYRYGHIEYGRVVEIPLPGWDEDQQAAVLDVLRRHPVDAAALILKRFPPRLHEALLAIGIDLFVDWTKDQRSQSYDFQIGTLAYVLSNMIEQDPLLLLILRGFDHEKIIRLFDPHPIDKPSLAGRWQDYDGELDGFWSGRPFPTGRAFKPRRSILREHIERAPLASKEILSIVADASQKARSVQRRFKPPVWEETPVYVDMIQAPPPLPKMSHGSHQRLEAIAQLTDAFCAEHIAPEADADHIAQLARHIIGLSLTNSGRKVMRRGLPATWACAVLYLLGTSNHGAFDRDFMCDTLGVSVDTALDHVEKIRSSLQIMPDDVRWMTPHHRQQDPRLRLWRDASGIIYLRETDSDE
jgi:hypothetical protein